jgi:hypothetical protein
MAPTENTDDPNAQFSRYTGEDDDRGASMVAKHLKAQVANNREAALATLKAVWPLVRRPGPRVRLTALWHWALRRRVSASPRWWSSAEPPGASPPSQGRERMGSPTVQSLQ